MQLVRFTPARELQRMEQDLQNFWDSGRGLPLTFTEPAAMDLYEEDGKIVTEVILPNFTKDEIKVDINDGALEIFAEHSAKEERKGKRRYFLRESRNHYLRRVALPDGANTDKAEATFADNILTVTMPITPTTKPKEVNVK